MLNSIFANIAIIALVLVVWQTIAEQVDLAAPRLSGVVTGGLLGLAGCFSILTAQEVVPGVLIDLRTATVACAAFFGGPVAAVIAMLLTGSLRAYYGGDGLIPGLVAITTSGLFALLLRRFVDMAAITFKEIGLLSLGVSVGYGFAYLFIPFEMLAAVFSATFVPMFALNFVTTFGLACISSRELRRQDLVRKDAIYRQIVDFLPDPLLAKDAEGRVIAANSASAALIGVEKPSDLLGRSNVDFLTLPEAERATAEEMAVLRSGATFTVERRLEGIGNGETWMSMKKVALFDSARQGVGVLVLGRDVTEHHRLLRMKSEFIALVSHELRTPLTSLRGALALLPNTFSDGLSPGSHKLLTIAQRNSDRLVRLINDILDVEKIEDGSLEFQLAPQELGALVTEALPSFEKYMPEQNVAIRFEDRAPGAVATIDGGRFEQVLSNLVSNAIKFSVQGGTVTIALDQKDDTVVLSVSDQGSGISDAFRAQIFDRFMQSDASDTRSKGGTGLGLHIAKVFVEKMGGTIAFDSVEGEGTTFFVHLPAGAPSVVTERTSSLAASQQPSSAPKLLYLEDDCSPGELLKELLSDEVEVHHVGDLHKARAALAAEEYDALLIDDELPDGSGLSLLDTDAKLPPVIVFTARDVRCSKPTKVRHHFVKTLATEQEVVDAIRGLLNLPAAA